MGEVLQGVFLESEVTLILATANYYSLCGKRALRI